MLPKVGQRIRVFSLVPNSWIIGTVLDLTEENGESKVRVLIEDWVVFPRNFVVTISTKEVELISGGI